MRENLTTKLKTIFTTTHILIFILCLIVLFSGYFLFPQVFTSVMSYPPQKVAVSAVTTKHEQSAAQSQTTPDAVATPIITAISYSPLDKAEYDKKMLELANNPAPKLPYEKVVKDPKTGKKTTVTITPKSPTLIWPVKDAPYPKDGALLPFNRIIAYYGNLYSTKMGVLGQYPPDEMLTRLNAEVKKWQDADPSTPVIPALHYIVSVAQGAPGADGKYRARMPDSEIQKVLAIADRSHAIVFLDVQDGFSTLESELPPLYKYLKLPNVHLGIDPEFSMKTGVRPGKVVGTFDADDVNYAANYLAKIVKENNLPPKILIVHRYTEKMVTNYKNIKPLPEVQIIMNMDGWGPKLKKLNTYQQFVASQPVQFTGFKLFYKNDVLDAGSTMLTPAELLKLNPRPIYIQFQ